MDNKVMAMVDNQPITMADVMYFIQAMGPQGAQYNNEQGYQLILEQLISQRLLFLDATKNGLAFDAEYKQQLEMAKRDLLTSYAINKLLNAVKVTEEDCKKEYEANKANYQKGETISASHILVDDEEKAKTIASDINSGKATFEDAAKEFSSCPSSANGGSLGEFGKGQMVPEFEAAAFALDVDAVSEPVKTQFGYHIIKVTAKSESAEMSYDEVKDQIEQQLLGKKKQEAIEKKVNQLKILYPVDMKNSNSGIIV